ncbi:MAG: pirin family protein [Nannocystaceae bacterium]
MSDPILQVAPLGFPWPCVDPFLFCVHHDDAYPAGNEALGPAASLAGRDLGQDFAGKDGWRMYHGERVPGFPQHPHRGFETVTVVRRGLVDHSDSLGAAARFGGGDAQWLTAGRGIVHAEMFPLLRRDADNPLELFQIWLNLPAADKLAEPHFAMLWSEDIPQLSLTDDAGGGIAITTIAGALGSVRLPAPPPRSWASRPGSNVAIWTLALEPSGARWRLPPAPGTTRCLYFFVGDAVTVGTRTLQQHAVVLLDSDHAVPLCAGERRCELLLLQGRPIAEPVAQQGPFVMNTRAEIQQAYLDYQRTRFGGWPWPDDDPVHGATRGRFARHVDGRVEERG